MLAAEILGALLRPGSFQQATVVNEGQANILAPY